MLRIKLADSSHLKEISSLCHGRILGIKIMCQINAYGFERDFLYVWLCLDGEGSTVGVISKFETGVSLVGSFDSGADDVRTFLDMIGYRSLCCTCKTATDLNYGEFVTKKAYIYTENYSEEILSDLTENYYKGCYSLISRSIPNSFSESEEAYLSFLSDFTFRNRRGLARIKGFTENDKVLSCALTSAETKDAAIISGVACDGQCRKTGLGKKTVLSLAQELKNENKVAYVIALNEKAEGFYEHIGFELKEKISFIERK